ncbi:MAG TPA: hypothetical protein EYP60_00305 [bacterium (Candidatus Stahlbacteria)]|nr:hypothetical protein [Candidatus Stahlbacteria bacterium]
MKVMWYYPRDWVGIAKEIVKKPGKVLVLGASDTGKTAICEFLANQGYKAGLNVGVIDLDIGQSHIGPPGTIGFGRLTQEIVSLSDIAPLRLYEVGEISPSKNPLLLLRELKELLRKVEHYDFDLIVVDSTGYIKGLGAYKIKEGKINLIKPDYVIILEKENEMEHLRTLLIEKGITVYEASVPHTISKKTKAMRRKFRTESSRRYNWNVQ